MDKEGLAYGKAIDGYQFLVNRYHTWMNYYSIFTGAFFIALYTMWDKAETVKCACCKCCETTASAPDYFLLGLIIILGWFSSVCWLASLIGHRAWMGSWIQVVKKWEETVLGNPSNGTWSSVYRKIVAPDTSKTPHLYLTRFISTQKVTTIFVYAVILAWDVLFGYLLYRIIPEWYLPDNWIQILIAALAYLGFQILNGFCLWYVNKKTSSFFSDDLTGMIQ